MLVNNLRIYDAMKALEIPIEAQTKGDTFKKRQGLKIKLARIALGITQKELARILNVCQRQMSAYESGDSSIDAIAIFRIAKALHQDIGYFSPFE